MNIMPFHMMLWRFDDGSTGIDERAMWYLRRWLTEIESIQLCASLSKSRLLWLDGIIRKALYP